MTNRFEFTFNTGTFTTDDERTARGFLDGPSGYIPGAAKEITADVRTAFDMMLLKEATAVSRGSEQRVGTVLIKINAKKSHL